jgi:hypothetical protein
LLRLPNLLTTKPVNNQAMNFKKFVMIAYHIIIYCNLFY